MSYENFSSLPAQEERTFVVYEQRSVEAGKKAMMIGMIVAAVFGLVVVVISMSFPAPKNKMADDDMGNLTVRKDKKDTKAATPAPAEQAPAEEAPAAE